MTKKIYGNFTDVRNVSDNIEYLRLSFQPNFVPLKTRWRNNGLSADFLGDYITTFFPKVEDDPETITRQREIQAAVTYIANELLENAMKYSDALCSEAIDICLHIKETEIIITESNLATPDQIQNFIQFVEKLVDSDPMTMYFEHLEAKAGDSNVSGLGYLTMINDYNAGLAWEFSDIASDGSSMVTTEVKIPL